MGMQEGKGIRCEAGEANAWPCYVQSVVVRSVYTFSNQFKKENRKFGGAKVLHCTCPPARYLRGRWIGVWIPKDA